MKAVIDANVLLHGRKTTKFRESLTVPEVRQEMKTEEGKQRFRNSNIDVRKAPEPSLEKVKKISQDINSPTSETDEKLVALAENTDATVVSDDKAVQNLALHLGIDFQGYMEGKIQEKRKWRLECSSCGKETSRTPCPRCGSQNLVRKPC